jgi:N-6 DNA Methylase
LLIFDTEAKPNILAFEDSQGMNVAGITQALNSPINWENVEEIEEEKAGLLSKKALVEKADVSRDDITSLLVSFENAKTFGSLIQVPPRLAAKVPEIEQRLSDVLKHGDLTHAPAYVIKPLLQQARLLAKQYDAVVANPPYMGGKYFFGRLKDFVAKQYDEAKGDLYACFIVRNLSFTTVNGFVGMITIPNWMFLSSFETLRKSLFAHQAIDTFIHNGRGVFGSDFGTCSFVIRNSSFRQYRGVFNGAYFHQLPLSNSPITL